MSDPSGPGSRVGYLALAPSFESGAASIVEVDSIHVILTRVSDGEVALDSVMPLTTDSDSVDLSLSISMSSASEAFSLTLECLSPTGEVVFSAGPLDVTATSAGGDNVVAEDVPITYVGIGADAASVEIVYGQSVVGFGDTLEILAHALDDAETTIEGTPIKWISHDTTMAVVVDPAEGLIVGNRVRGMVNIEALLLTGQADTVEVFVEPVPNSISIVSGNNQTGQPDTQLSLPITVEVSAVDGTMSDVMVLFSTADGSVRDGSVITDMDGQASTAWTLGSQGGTQTATATVQGYPGLTTTFSAVVGGVAASGINWIAGCPGGDWSDPAGWDLGRIPTSADTINVTQTGGECQPLLVDIDATVRYLNIQSGAVRVDAGVTLTVDTSLTVSGRLELASGSVLDGDGLVSVPGRMELRGAYMNGTGLTRVEAGGQFYFMEGTNTLGANRRIQNDGRLVWLGGDIMGGDASGIYNQLTGQVELSGDNMAFGWDSAGTVTSFVSVGTVTRYIGTGTVTFHGLFTSTGKVDLRSGDISLAGVGSLADTVYVAWGSELSVAGTISLADGLVVSDSSSGLAPGTLGVTGNVTTSGSILIETGLANGGYVQVLNDTLKLASRRFNGSYGTFLVNDVATLEFADPISTNLLGASTVTGPGTVLFSGGQVQIDGTYDVARTIIDWGGVGGSPVPYFNDPDTSTVPVLRIEAGYLDGTGVLEVTDTLVFRSGTLRGTGVKRVDAGGVFLLEQDISKMVDEGIIDNSGTTIATEGYMILRDGATFNNLAGGTFDSQSDFEFRGSGTLGTFNNDGTILKSGGTGATDFNVALVNNGVVDVESGSIAFNSEFTHSDGAVLQGNGTFDFTSTTTLAFNGDVSPGASPGILNFINDAQMSSQSTATIELGGTTAGTGYDQANISGDILLAGTLDVSLYGGFTPSIGESFTVLTFTGREGGFETINGLDVGGGVLLDTVWTATSLSLVAGAAAPPQILFAGDSGGGLSTGLFAVDPDGTNRARIWNTGILGYERWYPRWSPDRSRIALSFGSAASNQLYVLSADGSEVRGVVGDTSTHRARWSPDGTHLAFECADVGGDNADVCVILDVTAAIPSLPQNAHISITDFDVVNWQNGPGSFAWDPLDSDRIAVVRDSIPPLGGAGQSMIYLMPYDGSSQQRLLATGVLDVGNGPLSIIGPMDWSPDGTRIVFSARNPAFETSIYIINIDGTGLTRLTSGATNYDVGPQISPSGSEMMFGRDVDGCSYDLWLMNPDGTNQRQITNEQICDYELTRLGADWSPDGTEIVMTGFDNGNLGIYKIPSTSTAATYLTVRELVGRTGPGSTIMDIQPSWRP